MNISDLKSIMISLGIIVSAVILIKVISVIRDKSNATGKKKTIYNVVSDAGMYLMAIIAVIIVLDINGFNVRGLVTGLGIAGAIAGIAFQDAFKDIIKGLQISTEGYFYVGDAIVVDGIECVVADFNLRSTKLRVIIDGSSIIISNRLIDRVHRMPNVFFVDVPIGYNEDVENIRRIIKNIVEKCRQIPGIDSAAFKGTEVFGESAIFYRMRFMSDPMKKNDLVRQINGIIQDELRKEGISIPYNQMDVHIQKEPEIIKRIDSLNDGYQCFNNPQTINHSDGGCAD